MATYSTDFSSYTLAAQPSDWTSRWDDTSFTAIVDDTGTAADYIGGKYLYITKTADETCALTWDAIDSDANRDEVEILMKVMYQDGDDDYYNLGALARGADATTASRDAISSYVHCQFNQVITRRTNAGAEATENTKSLAWKIPDSKFIWSRTRIVGTDVKVKVWRDGDVEPTTWLIDAAHGGPSAVGWVGLTNHSNDQLWMIVDYYAVGTNGDTAPMPAVNTAIEIRTSGAYAETLAKRTPELSVAGAYAEVLHSTAVPEPASGAIPLVFINC